MDLPNSIKDTIHVVDLTSDSSDTPSTDQENVASPSTPNASGQKIAPTPLSQNKLTQSTASPYFRPIACKPRPIDLAIRARASHNERERQALGHLDTLLPAKLKDKLRFDLRKPLAGGLRSNEKRFLAASSEIERLRRRLQLFGDESSYGGEDDQEELAAEDGNSVAQVEVRDIAQALRDTLPIDLIVHYRLRGERSFTSTATGITRLLTAAKSHIDFLQGVGYEDERYREMEDEERESNVELWGRLPQGVIQNAGEGLPGTRVCRAANKYIEELEERLRVTGERL